MSFNCFVLSEVSTVCLSVQWPGAPYTSSHLKKANRENASTSRNH